jgi:hypothetical protein
VPPLHGTNPHGQGTIGVIQLAPTDTRPLSGKPDGSGDLAANRESVILGRARGDFCDSTSWCAQVNPAQLNKFHGHITILSLFGNEILSVDTNEGQTHTGPLDALQKQVLDNLCNGSGHSLCVNVLTADSITSNTGSLNHFAVANADVGAGANGGPPGLHVGAANSNGNIVVAGGCELSVGSTRVADVNAGSTAVVTLLTSETDVSACNNGTHTQTSKSSVIGLGGTGVPLPAPGCANGTANTDTGIPVIAPMICNADDPGTAGQASIPYAVREALDVCLLNAVTPPLTCTGAVVAKITTAASEAAATCPTSGFNPCSTTSTTSTTATTGVTTGVTTGPTTGVTTGVTTTGHATTSTTSTTGPPGRACSDADHDCGIGPNGEREVCNANGTDPDGDGDCVSEVAALPSKATLPFTGYDALTAVLLGLTVLGSGLVLRQVVRRRSDAS